MQILTRRQVEVYAMSALWVAAVLLHGRQLPRVDSGKETLLQRGHVDWIRYSVDGTVESLSAFLNGEFVRSTRVD